MKIKIVVLAAGLLLTNCLFAQKYLDEYIQIGLTKNLSIQQQNFALEKSVYALKEAKTLFLPRVSFMTDYFMAGGGRTVDFPVGDLLNPVYTTLNQLTGGNNFPQVTNQSILLNPNNFYDARFRTTLPLLNMEIAYNKRIKKDQVSMQQIEIDLFKRELAKEIKLAYYKYLQAAEAIKIYNAALDLVKESSRINSVLHANDKVNNTVIVRAKNEVSKIEAMQKTAVQNAQSAQAYFNFLLNRNLADSILMDYDYNQEAAILPKGAAISGREELKKLALAGHLNKQVVGLTQSYIIPKLNTFIDLGSQGFDGAFDEQSRYYFMGLSLKWDLFSSGANTYKIKQAQQDSKINNVQTDYVASQLQLQLVTSEHAFNAAVFNYQFNLSNFGAAQKYYQDILRLYKSGQALFIELLDAQNQLIQAELQSNISLYETHIKAAEFERASATLNIQSY